MQRAWLGGAGRQECKARNYFRHRRACIPRMGLVQCDVASIFLCSCCARECSSSFNLSGVHMFILRTQLLTGYGSACAGASDSARHPSLADRYVWHKMDVKAAYARVYEQWHRMQKSSIRRSMFTDGVCLNTMCLLRSLLTTKGRQTIR